LTDCLRKDDRPIELSLLSGLSPEQWQALLAFATVQRVKSLLWYRLRQKGLDEAVPTETAKKFHEDSFRNTAHNLRFYDELRRLLSALKPEGISLILLKGIFLAQGVYSNIGCREMNDIDILARPEHLERIAAILTGMGYAPIEPISAHITINAEHHLPRIIKPGHGNFEIHWNLTSPDKKYSIRPEELWERAKPAHIDGFDALTLSPEDLLLHLCLHTSYQHQFVFGLRPFCDIAETIAHFGPALNWQISWERAFQWGWQRGVYLALRLAQELVGADVPADILERLRPSDIPEAVLETVRTQIFGDKGFARSITLPFAELLESRHFIDKIRIFWRRVFLPRAIIASLYSVPTDSLRIYCYYPRRIVDVLRRHGHILRKYHQNDGVVKSLVERTNSIANWLNGSTHYGK